MSRANTEPQNVEIPPEVADAWAAVLVGLYENCATSTVPDGALGGVPNPLFPTRDPIKAAQMQRMRSPRTEQPPQEPGRS